MAADGLSHNTQALPQITHTYPPLTHVCSSFEGGRRSFKEDKIMCEEEDTTSYLQACANVLKFGIHDKTGELKHPHRLLKHIKHLRLVQPADRESRELESKDVNKQTA